MKKFLYISNSRIPTEKAHGIQIMKMCEAFTSQDSEVELILPTRKNKLFKNINVFDYYGVVKNFKIKKILSHDPAWLMFLPNGIYIKGQIFFFVSSLFFFLLFKKNKKEYFFYARDEYLLPLLLRFSRKVIWEAHTLPKNSRHYLKYWQKCAGIIAVTRGLKDDLIKLGVAENKIIVASDGVDLNNFQFSLQFGWQAISNFQLREKLGLPADKKTAMYTGHFYDWKGVQILAEAVKFLDDNVVVVFVGGTDYDLNNFKNRNRELIESGKILLLGYRPPKEIPEFLAAADCLVLPNSAKELKSEKWTSPLKMFEYMAVGKPIVASDLPSIREILNESNSVLVEPDNPRELAKGIETILKNNDLAEKISRQALVDIKEFSWDKRADKILNYLYE